MKNTTKDRFVAIWRAKYSVLCFLILLVDFCINVALGALFIQNTHHVISKETITLITSLSDAVIVFGIISIFAAIIIICFNEYYWLILIAIWCFVALIYGGILGHHASGAVSSTAYIVFLVLNCISLSAIIALFAKFIFGDGVFYSEESEKYSVYTTFNEINKMTKNKMTRNMKKLIKEYNKNPKLHTEKEWLDKIDRLNLSLNKLDEFRVLLDYIKEDLVNHGNVWTEYTIQDETYPSIELLILAHSFLNTDKLVIEKDDDYLYLTDEKNKQYEIINADNCEELLKKFELNYTYWRAIKNRQASFSM